MSHATATFICADQRWKDETTVYWFRLDGIDYGTGVEFSGEIYGISETGPDSVVVDSEGYPLTEGDPLTIAVLNTASVSGEMRREAAGL